MLKVFLVVLLLILAGLALRPAERGRSRFQKISQFLVYRLDPNYSRIIDSGDIDKMKLNENLCFRNVDCVLVMCGARPNEFSFSVNQYSSLDEDVACLNTDGEAWWGGQVKCKERRCVFDRLVAN